MAARRLADGFLVRDGLDDERNYTHVVTENEYRLPDAFPPGAIIVDVGAQCGCFSHAVLLRGAGKVYAFEAERSNFEQVLQNLSAACEAGRAEIAHRAVWRSDGRGPVILHFTPSEDPSCSGGGNVLRPGEGQAVVTIPLDTILTTVTAQGLRRIHLLKLDCEGSEWPILFTATRLDLVDQIIGEYHEIGGPNMAALRPDQAWPSTIPDRAMMEGYEQFTASELEAFLVAQGFSDVQIVPYDWWFGLFFARRPA